MDRQGKGLFLPEPHQGGQIKMNCADNNQMELKDMAFMMKFEAAKTEGNIIVVSKQFWIKLADLIEDSEKQKGEL